MPVKTLDLDKMGEEQEQISKSFEKLPHATQRAVNEMMDGKTTYRYPEKEL